MRRGGVSGAVAAAVLLLAAVAHAALEVPYLAGRVNDLAGLLSADAKGRLEAASARIEEESGAQVAVLTVDSLEGEPIERYSMRVAETWKLGGAERDDGVLLLIARNDRQMRLEVGYGLEPVLTDALSRQILDNVVRPAFRQGDFDGGVERAVAVLGDVLGGRQVDIEPPAGAVGGQPLAPRLFGLLIFVLVVGVFSLSAVFNRDKSAWVLYVFLLPFYLVFGMTLLTPLLGLALGGLWLLGFPFLRFLFWHTAFGTTFLARHPAWTTTTGSGRRYHSGGFFGGGGGFSGGGGGFSGGGGSFGGGGASSSW